MENLTKKVKKYEEAVSWNLCWDNNKPLLLLLSLLLLLLLLSSLLLLLLLLLLILFNKSLKVNKNGSFHLFPYVRLKIYPWRCLVNHFGLAFAWKCYLSITKRLFLLMNYSFLVDGARIFFSSTEKMQPNHGIRLTGLLHYRIDFFQKIVKLLH